jgi:type IV pilus assembly protein PilN
MRIAVNLASRPYVELRPVYSRLRLWMIILALFGVALWLLLHSDQREAGEARARVQAVQQHVQQLENQQQEYQALMRQPQNAAVLTQAEFLNNLFRHKAFSWTATMTDLETVLPAGVQVQSIEPIVAPSGHVTIRMRVSGGREQAVNLVRNLEKSKHFASPRLAAEALSAAAPGTPGAFQTVGTGDVNFDILADYRPLPLTDEEGAKSKDGAEKTELALTPAPSPAKASSQPKTPHPSRRRP